MMKKKVLIVIDLQNDVCHHEGVYAKNGLAAPQFLKIIPNIIEAIHFCKNKQIPTIGTQMTVLEDLNKKAMGLDSMELMRPFLVKGGLRENTWGHEIIEELPSIDYKVRKWGLSSFYQTELAKYLSSLECGEIVLTGFTTNGAVETLAREAIGRNFVITTLTDCVASYSDTLHHASLNNLGAFGKILSSKEWFSQMEMK